MRGIVQLNSYIPKYYIEINEINEAWGVRGGKGKRAVANIDEDVVTMAVETVIESGVSENIKTCILATTSSPFKEESAASIVAYTLGLEKNCRAIDINQSITGGLSSLAWGIDQPSNNATTLIIASDNRETAMGSSLEKELADAACAVEIGEERVIAEIVAHEKNYDFGYETWQRSNDKTIFVADEKFSAEVRKKHYVDAAQNLLEKSQHKLDDITHLIVADRNERMTATIANALGKKELAQTSSLYKEIGFTGVSMPFLMLDEVMQKAKAGDLVLCMQSGSGVEAVLFRITPEIERYKEQKRLEEQLVNRTEVKNYQQFLQKRNQISRSDLKPYSTLAYLRRERETNLRLIAQECEHCATIHFPKHVLCRNCKQKLNSKKRALAHNGVVFTFTNDYVFPGNESYMTMGVIDLEGGGRIFTQMTDAENVDIAIGQKVKLVFRKIHEGADYPNYFWKGVPYMQEGF